MIQIGSEFKNLIPPLSSEERQGLADTIGVSKTTWIARMKEPWKQFGLDDFRLLSKYCRVDFVELVNGKLRLKGD